MSRHLAAFVLLSTLVAGCDDDADGGAQRSSDAGTADGAVGAPDAEPAADAAPEADAAPPADGLPPAPPQGEMVQIDPGGDTICSRGTPFHFFARGGDPTRLVVDFGGGGACWDSLTCSAAGAIFSERATPLAQVQTALDAGLLGGLYDPDDPANPVGDWTFVHVPYCTGDLHWGDNTQDYGNGVVVEHKGFVNARAVLDWVYARYPDVDEILVTGCSAGSYGAIVHSAYIAQHYADARMTVLGDSGAGIITDTWFEEALPSWNARAGLPDFVERLQGDLRDKTLVDVYAGVAETYPQHRFAHYTSAFDKDQTFYYSALGGDAAEWPALLRARMEAMRAAADNFRYFIAPGPVHCVILYPFFGTRAAGDVLLQDWLRDLLFADDLPDDAACEGEGCFDDAVCAACAEDGSGLHCRFCEGWPEDYRPGEDK
ncbi:MAG: pectinesterase [Myxococcales bacterium]|nr:pectinesterase [Myxococcales bacterium]